VWVGVKIWAVKIREVSEEIRKKEDGETGSKVSTLHVNKN
jgi:hypothetical protein